VTVAHDTSDAFSDEILKEHAIFQYTKEAEMKEILSNTADGQIELYKRVSDLRISFAIRDLTIYS
jgi:sorting nexin-4